MYSFVPPTAYATLWFYTLLGSDYLQPKDRIEAKYYLLEARTCILKTRPGLLTERACLLNERACLLNDGAYWYLF